MAGHRRPVRIGSAPVLADMLARVAMTQRHRDVLMAWESVVSIDPPGRNCPLHERAHCPGREAWWRKVGRLVSDQVMER